MLSKRVPNYYALPAILISTLLVVIVIYGWTEPSSVPPGGNIAAPLNTSINAQAKEGALVIGANPAVTTGLIVQNGSVQFGGAMIFKAISPPAVSAADQVTMYYDLTTKDLKVSINAQPYVNLMSGATVPAQITGLSASGDAGQVSLSWSVPSNGGRTITSYRIYRSLSAGSQVYLTTADTNSFTNSGLATSSTYYYKVSAVNSIGEAPLSNEASAWADILLAGGSHTKSGCLAAGGGFVNVGGSTNICRFNSDTCPSGWSKYLSWSTTQSNSCSNGGGWPCTFWSNCQTGGGHAWANDGTIETCTYYAPGIVNYNYACPEKVCYATITQIGCY